MASKKHDDTSAGKGSSKNFADDPQRASAAGKKGGSRSGSQSQAEGTKTSGRQQGGSGTLADEREGASDAGSKGGKGSRHSR